MKRVAVLCAVVASALGARPARAQPAPRVGAGTPALPPSANGATLGAAAGQQALALKVDGRGLLARVCPETIGCVADGGTRLNAPADVATALGAARFSTVTLADGKHLAWIEVSAASKDAQAPVSAAWVALIAAPLAGKGEDPVVVWTGWTGMPRGEEGELRTNVVVREPVGRGERVVVAQRREDVTLCGRPALVAARELDPQTLSLVGPVAVDNIGADDKNKATKLVATRGVGAAAPAIGVLKAKDASSAVDKKVATLTDGDAETVWSEDRPGIGRGEWIRVDAAADVAIRSLEIVVRPTRDVPDGAAPRTLVLVADGGRLFDVRLPEDGWRSPNSRFVVAFPAELQTGCLTIVLDDAYAPANAKNTRVTLAEVVAHTAFDAMDPVALVAALSGGGERARAAAALLDRARGGAPATKALIEGYDKLDEAGKQLALGGIDTAPCGEKVGFFARLLAKAPPSALRQSDTGPDTFADGELRHARDRLRQCKRESAPPLAELVRSGAAPAKLIAAGELALIAPDQSVAVIVDALGGASDASRRELRAALATAARSPRARDAFAKEVAPDQFGGHSELARIDLLRSIGPQLGAIQGGAAALRSLALSRAPFRTRYLLQAPAAELARAGDRSAEAFVRESLRRDPDPHVRVHAAEVAARVPSLGADLVAAVDDADVRVREAALGAIAEAAASNASARTAGATLVRRLGSDAWTFVRVGAARALAALPADRAADGALAAALADATPDVRAAALDALGAHRASAYVTIVRARADDRNEAVEVRARAILALGAMCDRGSVDTWTKLARRTLDPKSDEDRRLGTASLAALATLHPPDLQQRVAPLLAPKAPPWVRQMARVALSTPSACR